MGTLSSLTGGSGGGGSPLPQPEWLTQKSSFTYTFPYDGVVRVHVVGAGGSGGKQYNRYHGHGGGAGGYARKQFTVTTSTTATVTTGVGGLPRGEGHTSAAGVAGTNTTFVLGATTITANGGSGGSEYPSALAQAAGGTATGGDVNYTGGRGGYFNRSYHVCGGGSGGGAVNPFGLPTGSTDGGSVLYSSGSDYATGGGGIGGRGGNINTYNQMIATGGGGSAGSATDIDAGTANNHPSDDRNSAGGAGGARLFIFNGIFFDGRGGMSLQPQFNNTYQGMTFPPYHDVGHGAGSGRFNFLYWKPIYFYVCPNSRYFWRRWRNLRSLRIRRIRRGCYTWWRWWGYFFSYFKSGRFSTSNAIWKRW